MSTDITAAEARSLAAIKEPPPRRTLFTIWRAGLWSGVAYCTLGLLFWAVIAGFLPPPQQTWGADRVKEFFEQPHVLIGIVGYCVIAPLWVPMSITLSRIMARIEGRDGILHRIEYFGGIGTTFITLFSGVVWLTAAYQPESRSASEINLLNDLGWIIFDMTFMVTFLQYLSFGVCVLLQRGDNPLFPRWLSWLSFMVCASFVPIVLLPFLPGSPFAWDGLLTYWVALGLFFAWVPCVLVPAFRAVSRIERETLG
jgi:hypothetical protein